MEKLLKWKMYAVHSFFYELFGVRWGTSFHFSVWDYKKFFRPVLNIQQTLS